MLGRRALLRAAAGAIGLVSGCAVAPVAPTSPLPSPTPTPTPTPSLPLRDFTLAGQGNAIVKELVSAAGTINAIKVEISEHAASLSVVSGMTATTWAYRNGQIGKVDSDTQYVGQSIFDPRDFNLADVGRMFIQAGQLSKSTSAQELQVVEYADRMVYITVTTNPESLTVFFRRDGTLVSPVDLSTAAGLSEALTDVTGTHREVLAVGVLPNNGGLWADRQGATGEIVRTIRMPKLPARTAVRTETTTLEPFDISLVDAAQLASTLTSIVAKGTASLGPGWSLTIDRRQAQAAPLVYWSVNGQQVVTTLAGVEITSR